MQKTLAIILNHNLPEYTDQLFESLIDHKSNIYDLRVMDNGSKIKYQSKYTSIWNNKNLFWGGALNIAFKLIIENKNYDSLLFLNNDIEVNGNIFVSKLRQALFDYDLGIASPCIAGQGSPWKQMHNWSAKNVRTVKWIDNQAPLFHRKVIEAISQFPKELNFGWGQELVCNQVCESRNWKIGVCDNISIVHYGQMTTKSKRLFSMNNRITFNTSLRKVNYGEFAKKARGEWVEYFKHDKDKFDQLVSYGNTYNSEMIETLPLMSI